MKIKIMFLVLTVIISITIQCSSDTKREALVSQIEEMEEILYGDTVTQIDRLKGMEMIQAYLDFADIYPDDTLSPEYLFKGAEIAMNMQMTGQSIEYFQRIKNNYPDFDKAPACLFMQAFIYENHLSQYDIARELYQQFLDEYPNHDLARDTEMSLKYMGQSLEELVKSWELEE